MSKKDVAAAEVIAEQAAFLGALLKSVADGVVNCRVQLVILDALMPKLHGRAVYDAVRSSKPGQKVIFVSGYGTDVLDEEFLRRERPVVVHKPFNVVDLARRVREVLDS